MKFDPAAHCPGWEKFIGEVFPDSAEAIAWEIPAWLMMPDTSIQRAVLLMRDGANGKSTYLRGVMLGASGARVESAWTKPRCAKARGRLVAFKKAARDCVAAKLPEAGGLERAHACRPVEALGLLCQGSRRAKRPALHLGCAPRASPTWRPLRRATSCSRPGVHRGSGVSRAAYRSHASSASRSAGHGFKDGKKRGASRAARIPTRTCGRGDAQPVGARNWAAGTRLHEARAMLCGGGRRQSDVAS